MMQALNVVSPDGVLEDANRRGRVTALPEKAPGLEDLASHLRGRFEDFKRHRTSMNLVNRYLDAVRIYQGRYTAEKLAQIRQFGGSEVYARLTAIKCRGASSLLRDVYMNSREAWSLEPTPEPSLGENAEADIEEVVASEAMALLERGLQPDVLLLRGREEALRAQVRIAQRKKAYDAAKLTQRALDDRLHEGGFYNALSEFLTDLPIYPFACIKGPVVRSKRRLAWVQGRMTVQTEPIMTWERVSPFDVYFLPGSSRVQDADVIERIRLRRMDLASCRELPGYNVAAINKVLEEQDRGLLEWLDESDTERYRLEGKENPRMNQSDMIDGVEFHGRLRGKWLLSWGFTQEQVPDPLMDYMVTAWLVSRYVIKVHINPNPLYRVPYYVSSFEKIPGSLIGYGLTETLSDIQDVSNASLRALVNNMAIASGPQVAINEERLSPTADADSLYPWKRWRFISDPTGQDMSDPIRFFNPNSNSSELLGIYKAMFDLADEVSAIPRYLTGSQRTGGAASTASGLSMLMNNASKVLQNVAANIDQDVLKPLLQDLYTMIALVTQGQAFQGDEQIVVNGATVAMRQEQDRMRRLEFLQMTNNPVDLSITGQEGRGAVLSSIAEDLGLPYAEVVPNRQRMADQGMAQPELSEAAAQAQGSQPQMGRNNGSNRIGAEFDNAQRVNQ